MKTLHSCFRAAPKQDGDKAIRTALMNAPAGNFKALDNAIDNLLSNYPLDQIYKVYYKTFG